MFQDKNLCYNITDMKQNIIIGILIIIIIVGFGLIFAPKTSNITTTPQEAVPTQATEKVKIEDLTVGTGKEAKTGDTVVVNYKGTLEDGKQFDSSYDRNEPFTTKLGDGSVIKGWDQGIPGMKVGGKRKLTIPPSLGYGAQANGNIPANSTLIFEVELMDVK